MIMPGILYECRTNISLSGASSTAPAAATGAASALAHIDFANMEVD